MKIFPCRHKSLEVIRAHQLSETGLKFGHLAVATDQYGCYALIQCQECKQIIEVKINGMDRRCLGLKTHRIVEL